MANLWSKVRSRLGEYYRYRVSLGLPPTNPDSRRHGLPGQLIVSLTSYPARFGTLEATIHCLLSQSVAPDRIILWVGNEHFRVLPRRILLLQNSCFTVERTRDVRSFTKLMPCLERSPEAFIVACDDDVFYPQNWLAVLLESYRPGQRTVCCHRAHKIRFTEAGKPRSYADWEQETVDTEPSASIFPTGVGGVLYEPGAFHPDVIDADKYLSLCPSADDIWFFWMTALAGYVSQTTGLQNRPTTWPASQRISLRAENMPRGGGNDIAIGRMLAAYGAPFIRS